MPDYIYSLDLRGVLHRVLSFSELFLFCVWLRQFIAARSAHKANMRELRIVRRQFSNSPRGSCTETHAHNTHYRSSPTVALIQNRRV